MSSLDERAKEFKERNKQKVIKQIQKLMERNGINTSDLSVIDEDNNDAKKLIMHRSVAKHKEQALEALKKAREVKAAKKQQGGNN